MNRRYSLPGNRERMFQNNNFISLPASLKSNFQSVKLPDEAADSRVQKEYLALSSFLDRNEKSTSSEEEFIHN